MTAINAINSAISKTRDAVGSAAAIGDAVSNLPGVPDGLRNAIGSLFGTGRGLAPSQNRRDLNNFLGTASKLKGFARPSQFYIEIAPPYMMRADGEDARTLAFLCESANLPGVSFATSEIRRYGYGPVERKPYAPIFVDTTMTFLTDASGLVQKFFYKWMNGIIKFDEPVYGAVGQAGDFQLNPFEVNYKDQYMTDILVTTVDEANNDIINVRFKEAYPIFMGDVNLGWADTDSISRLPITFTFFNWKIERININQIQERRSPGALQSLLKVGTAVQTLAALRKPNNVADVINVVNNAKIAIGGLI
jgi:hypothetical protein